MGKMDDRVCIITGGAGSIGLASANLLHDEGGSVMLVDNNTDNITKALESLGGESDRVAAAQADVSSEQDTQNYIDQTLDKWGRIDVLFCNAGFSGNNKPIADFPIDTFDAVIAANVRGPFLACKLAMPHMGDGGSVIITSSIMGVQANPNTVAYATSKHAVIGMMRSIAKEVAPRNIRVNAIAPGPIDNDFQLEIENRMSKVLGIDATEMLNQRIPLRRHGTPDEVAQSVLFLASDMSSFSTGSVFMADGGMAG
ncbi:MAG: SDR family oxidoreductase [Rhodospirillaceae bacterium]|jgi:NAD(P)-dependent dehydrogenase (short-subunit alcohol dehydrogenase family)|nr:SDR family oxidoreductase [Rhodospirillales bacterium]MBT3905962.1 SDR family oxidoreductase [Rhodospirillaceae bacterium]MBT4703822.1 SDR family oxidoreductase [Rhodospirillaceae bacterium]MBT5034563.1 SDR family oxidoreductase [Rhodospirillaceae bacterium]MBT6221206.1 SDR family oxidoreductase [Rhodospirillaceae bacterium]